MNRVLAAALVGLYARPAFATYCVVDAWPDAAAPASGDVFPNWQRVWAGSYDVLFCDPLSCPGAITETIKALTVANFGSATNADITNVYWLGRCGATTTGTLTMTYAGVYAENAGPQHAWTWNGTSVALDACPDLCTPTPCGGWFTLDLYVDVASCPTQPDTIMMGLPTQIYGTTFYGSLTDNNGCQVPWGDLTGPSKTIVYVVKEASAANVAPGDTVTYTVTYGRPGTAALSSITVMDTQPPYTHYVAGGGSPAPDVSWDPDFGPPLRLRWSGLAGGAVTGGPTSRITFQVTVDWGNEPWDPGSGNVAAPEGARLDNQAQVFWNGAAGCATSMVNPPVTTTVKRWLAWLVPDQDILMASAPGQPPDEVVYETFVRNLSNTRTWWNVKMWDTVPPELDVWCLGCGFEDPCPGPWTISPTGCAANSPGVLLSGARTLLTWSLAQMAPGLTLSVKWKAQLKSISGAGATAVSIFSLKSLGFNGIGGSADSGPPRQFASLTKVYLRTTYISYVAFAFSSNQTGQTGGSTCWGWFLPFFPLNRSTQFELRSLEYMAAATGTPNGYGFTGGLSASIGCLIGDCLGGFPGNPGPCPAGAISAASSVGSAPGGQGCRPERIPARFMPSRWYFPSGGAGDCPTEESQFLYKVTGNAPVAWQCLTNPGADNVEGDSATFAPGATLSYTGFIHYHWRRAGQNPDCDSGDNISLINTGIDAFGAANPSQDTTVAMFQFDFASNAWQYRRVYDIAGESQAYDMGTMPADEGPWRMLSSDAQLIVSVDKEASHFAEGNYGYLWPTSETGNVVGGIGSGTFYGIAHVDGEPNKVVIGNVGTADATYEVWRYVSAVGTTCNACTYLGGTSGTWVKTETATVPGGFAAAGNPRLYNCYAPSFDAGAAGCTLALFKVVTKNGGPLMVNAGGYAWTGYGGNSVLHASDGSQAGTDYWLHVSRDNGGKSFACSKVTGRAFESDVYTIDVFAPKTGMAIRTISEDGYSATYTTTGPDQCVAFLRISNTPTECDKHNFRVQVLGASPGKVIAQYIGCVFLEKGYTAPFLVTGTFYRVLAPPIVFQGQPFWITLVVVDPSGTTKDDYCGTTSFSGTDPTARIGGSGMDAYNYTWTSNTGPCGGGTDNGVKLFVNVTLTKLGMQTLVATDTVDGSITGLAAILVVATNVSLTKQPPLQVSASGDTVQFKICWSNYSTGSAFIFVITDAVPVGTAFVPETGTANLVCSGPPGSSVAVAYSTSTTSAPPAPGAFTTANPVAGTRWLRWTVGAVDVATTGCVCFRVAVN